MASTGQAIPLNYGFNWITGFPLQKRTIENSGDKNLDYTRVGMWLLGAGEMDGLIEMWDQGLGRLLYQNDQDDPTTLHFYSGCDALAGSGSFPSSTGGDQGVDAFWSSLAPGLQPLHYHRWAYYAIKLKQLINNPLNNHQDDPSVWADVNPIGLWKGIRCRIFDRNGTMIGYTFTRNPAWHLVDLLCRRKLFPEYGLDAVAGAEDLPAAVRRRFDWGALADTAAYCGETMSNGLMRFAGDYSFSQRVSLQSCMTQILTVSRSFLRERSGTYAMIADRPRASVFTFDRWNADSLVATDAELHTAPNQYIAKFRDLLVPAIGTIESITCPDHDSPTVTTQNAHCAAPGDYIVIGNTGSRYDGNWRVYSVPSGDQVFSMVLTTKGSNYPEVVGSGGLLGFRFSRFKERTPEFHHHQHQLARGAVGVGLPRQRNKVAVETDFANATWDQIARVSSFQRSTALGPDVVPYVTPKRCTLHAPLFAPDAAGSGSVAIQIEPGDVVTIDPTLSTALAGLYEVMPAEITLDGSSSADGARRKPTPGGLNLTLRPYADSNYPDVSPTEEPGWPDVPGLPGVSGHATFIPLIDGQAVFFSGSGADGDSLSLPDGFHLSQSLLWASPQGYIEADGQLHFIKDCDAYANRKLALVYNGPDNQIWHGDLNYCGIAWNSPSARSFVEAGVNYVELTLLGGARILFGKGILNSGTQVWLPSGYAPNGTIPLAFPKSSYDTGNNAHGFAGWIDTNGYLHHAYQDGEGHHWEGYGQAFLFSFQKTEADWRMTDNGWFYLPLPNGQTFAVAGHSFGYLLKAGGVADIHGTTSLFNVNGDNLLPLNGMFAASLQTMIGPNGFDIVDHPAHGIRRCYVDDSGLVVCNFEDGEGNSWGGSSSVFSLLCDVPFGAMNGQPVPVDNSHWGGTPGVNY